jgi:broad specificity phosphatase PhoE
MSETGLQLIVHFMRHAEVYSSSTTLFITWLLDCSYRKANIFQAIHKLSDVTDTKIRDPDLSPQGLEQCLDFAEAFKDQERYVTHILSSPMTRALNTACIAFRPIIESGLAVSALPQLQSLDKGPNGIGLDYEHLMKRYDGTHWDQFMIGKPHGWVDVTSFVPVGWNAKEMGK